MILVAHSLGLATVTAGLFDASKAAQILAVPTNIAVVLLLPLGYPDEQPTPPSRKELSEIAFYESYGRKAESVILGVEEKTSRAKIAAIKRKNPHKRQIDIARELNITRQRVNQVLKSFGDPPQKPPHPNPRYCANCGKKLNRRTKGELCKACYIADLHNRIEDVELTCPQCGRVFTKKKSYVNHHKKKGWHQFFCSGSCRSKANSRVKAERLRLRDKPLLPLNAMDKPHEAGKG